MALPRGAPDLKQINRLPAGLGKSPLIDVQYVSGMPPKPSGPPVKRNAALTGHQDGAKNIGKKRAASKSQKYAAGAVSSTPDDDRSRVVRAKHLEIALRYAWDAREKKRRGRPALMMKVRLRELERLFASRWGAALPDDDAGRDDLLIAAHHIAAIYRNPEEHIPAWIAKWAPWVSDAECAALVGKVAANPLKWTADKLAWRLRLTAAERTALKITTIGAIDLGKAAREKRRRQRNNAAKAARRREGGAVDRRSYEGASTARAEPWKALGMSRRTWYRKGKPQPHEPAKQSTAAKSVAQVRVQQKLSNMLSPQLCHGPQDPPTERTPDRAADGSAFPLLRTMTRLPRARLKRAPGRASVGAS